MLWIKFMSTFVKLLWWMPQNIFDDKSKLVQVMVMCRQATSHYLSQCWLNLCPHMAWLAHNELSLLVLKSEYSRTIPRPYLLMRCIFRSPGHQQLWHIHVCNCWHECVPVFHEERFQLPASSQCREVIQNANISHVFSNDIQCIKD